MRLVSFRVTAKDGGGTELGDIPEGWRLGEKRLISGGARRASVTGCDARLLAVRAIVEGGWGTELL